MRSRLPSREVITCPYYKLQQHSSVIILDVCKSAWVKIATKSIPKLLPEWIRNARELKFPKFFGGACPQTPLGGLWAYAHSLTVVTVHSQRSELPPSPTPPHPHFCYLFCALDRRYFSLSYATYWSHILLDVEIFQFLCWQTTDKLPLAAHAHTWGNNPQ